MKTTNAIEKALNEKIHTECKEIVDKFIADLIALQKKYGGMNYYDFKKKQNSSEMFYVSGTAGVSGVLHRMILDNHGSAMLKQKSKELINKLNLDI